MEKENNNIEQKSIKKYQEQLQKELTRKEQERLQKENERRMVQNYQIQANKDNIGEKKERSYKSPEERKIDIDYRYTMEHLKNYLKTIQQYEDLKKNVEQLDKVNKSLESLRDKKIKEKYETSKQSLEKKICNTLAIKKDKPQLLQSKKTVEQSFRDKIQKGLADFGAKADVAKKNIAEIKSEKIKQSSQRENKLVRRTTNSEKTIEPQKRARGR